MDDINTARFCCRPRDPLYTAIYGRVDVASEITIIYELSSRPRYANSRVYPADRNVEQIALWNT